MAESIAVSELQTICRDRTDNQNSSFITDDELLRYINTSYKELYNKLLKANSTYFMTETTINLVANQSAYTLPADFYKVQGVDIISTTTEKITAKPYSFENRNRQNYIRNQTSQFYWYIIQGDEIRFIPTPQLATSATLFYIPVTPTITAGTDTITSVNGGYQFLIADVCRRIAIKAEDSNVNEFVLEKREAIQDIMDNFATRDEGMPETVTDAYSLNDRYLFGSNTF